MSSDKNSYLEIFVDPNASKREPRERREPYENREPGTYRNDYNKPRYGENNRTPGGEPRAEGDNRGGYRGNRGYRGGYSMGFRGGDRGGYRGNRGSSYGGEGGDSYSGPRGGRGNRGRGIGPRLWPLRHSRENLSRDAEV